MIAQHLLNYTSMHPHDRYFENLKQKALEGANTEARIQVRV